MLIYCIMFQLQPAFNYFSSLLLDFDFLIYIGTLSTMDTIAQLILMLIVIYSGFIYFYYI